MRPLKFRAWYEKQMYPVTGIGFVQGAVAAIEMAINARGDTYEERELDHIVLMQFTGLTDKQGKEIYEGDIVKAKGWWEKPHLLIWPDDYYWIQEIDLVNSYHMEVIGNLYEDFELLNETNNS